MQHIKRSAEEGIRTNDPKQCKSRQRQQVPKYEETYEYECTWTLMWYYQRLFLGSRGPTLSEISFKPNYTSNQLDVSPWFHEQERITLKQLRGAHTAQDQPHSLIRSRDIKYQYLIMLEDKEEHQLQEHCVRKRKRFITPRLKVQQRNQHI